MTHYYFIIPNDLIEAMQGYQSGSNIFNAVQDIEGRWVCSINSVVEFPELFEGHSFTVVALDEQDFNQPEDPHLFI
jgi:hypothetical protein